MTKEEILAMEPGRKLDVLVAKEIFGVEAEWDYPSWDINHISPKLPFRRGEPRTVLGPMAHSVSNTIYEYSTDISAAWLVVEKMIKANRYFGLQRVVKDGEWLWEASFGEPAFGLEVPKAICKAALLSKLEVKDG